jgi:hypothetical protein
MTSTFNVIVLRQGQSVSQSAGHGALRQVDLGPTTLVGKLARVVAVVHDDYTHLEWTSAWIFLNGYKSLQPSYRGVQIQRDLMRLGL